MKKKNMLGMFFLIIIITTPIILYANDNKNKLTQSNEITNSKKELNRLYEIFDIKKKSLLDNDSEVFEIKKRIEEIHIYRRKNQSYKIIKDSRNEYSRHKSEFNAYIALCSQVYISNLITTNNLTELEYWEKINTKPIKNSKNKNTDDPIKIWELSLEKIKKNRDKLIKQKNEKENYFPESLLKRIPFLVGWYSSFHLDYLQNELKEKILYKLSDIHNQIIKLENEIYEKYNYRERRDLFNKDEIFSKN